MKRAFLLAALSLALAAPGRAADWKSVTPAEFASKTKVVVGSNALSYYRLEPGKPLRLTVGGPTQLKLLTRLAMSETATRGAYVLTVLVDGVAVKTDTLSTVPSKDARYPALEGVRPGAIRRVYVDVPTGTHGCEIRVEGRAVVDARVFRALGDGAPLVSVAPRRFGSVEVLKAGAKELTYYLLTKASSLVLDVTGPTTITVNTRLLFDHTMVKDQVYTVGVRADGGAERVYRIETRPSTSMTCRDRKDQVPGALRTLKLEVGKGRHTYEFRLADSVAEGVAVKFLIPRGDAAHAR